MIIILNVSTILFYLRQIGYTAELIGGNEYQIDLHMKRSDQTAIVLHFHFDIIKQMLILSDFGKTFRFCSEEKNTFESIHQQISFSDQIQIVWIPELNGYEIHRPIQIRRVEELTYAIQQMIRYMTAFEYCYFSRKNDLL